MLFSADLSVGLNDLNAGSGCTWHFCLSCVAFVQLCDNAQGNDIFYTGNSFHLVILDMVVLCKTIKTFFPLHLHVGCNLILHHSSDSGNSIFDLLRCSYLCGQIKQCSLICWAAFYKGGRNMQCICCESLWNRCLLCCRTSTLGSLQRNFWNETETQPHAESLQLVFLGHRGVKGGVAGSVTIM